jgi:hypothetical protein
MRSAETYLNPRTIVETVFGKRVGLFARIFGCYHNRMSRPVTTENVTYKYCPDCGIRRQFDPVKFKSEGAYYYPARDEKLHHV